MRDEPLDSLTERDRRDLTALADGSLPSRRRAAIEARLTGSPELRVALRRQQLAVAALGAIEVEAPAQLRARIPAGSRTPASRRRPWLAWAGAGAAALAAATLTVAMLTGGAAEPTVVETAELSALAPTEPAPKPRTGEPALLTASAEGLAYPNWRPEFGWSAAGRRSDELGGRDAATVYYDKDGRRISYTIVSGEPLDAPVDARRTTLEGTEFRIVRDDETTIVTWLRGRHTCVLAGKGVAGRTLVELAAWKGDGAVAF